MPRLIRYLEEPVVTTSIFSYYLLCESVARHRKVVLTGQGADEPWAGYARHRVARLLPFLRCLHPLLSDRMLSCFFSADEVLRVKEVLAARTECDTWRALHTLFPGEQREQIRARDARSSDDPLSIYVDFLPANGTAFERLLAFELRSSLPENLLLLGDKLSMAHGLEVRVPLLDQEYLRKVEALPGRLRLRGATSRGAKYLHKRVCAALLPREIIHRPKKGFQSPVETWLRGQLGDHLRRLIEDEDSFTRRYLCVDAARRLISVHSAGHQGNLERQLFAMWVLEEWHRCFPARNHRAAEAQA
jgi:asparagine synthase (glutamine-hydrolysing)